MEEYLNPLVMAFLICFLSLFFIWNLSSAAQSKLNLPPSPRALPVIGHLHLLGPIPHVALHKICTRLGPLVQLRLGSLPCIVASDAEIAKELLKIHDPFFAGRPDSKVISCLTYGTGGFIFAPYGAYWRFVKKLCMSELLGGRTLERLQWIRREEIGRFFETLHEKIEKRQKVDVGAELTRLTSNVIYQMVISRRGSSGTHDEAFELRKFTKELSEILGKFNIADFVGFCKNLDLQGLQKKAEDLQYRFDRMMEGILKEREDSRRRNRATCTGHYAYAKDLLDVLLDTSEDEGAEMKLTRENIKCFIRDVFEAGTDTSAITMEWALAELINHPAILQKARAEVDSVVGNSRLVDESDIPNLPFLQAIIKETLRLHPVSPLILRQSTEHCSVMGYHVPANTRLMVNVWAIGRDPKHWEDPLEFRPERFMAEGWAADVDLRGQHFQLLPFGSGRRRCPGISLALQVMHPTLAAMIQCFEWGVENGVVDMAEEQGLVVSRAHPLLCTPAARLHLPLPWRSV